MVDSPVSIGHLPGAKWEFDDQVTQVFEDMLQRSIPQYEVMRSSTVDIVKKFAREGSAIIDLGCSRGDLIDRLISEVGGYCRYVGVEVSESMLSAAKQRFSRHPESLVSIQNLDLRKEFPSDRNVCAVVSSLTLQFTPIEYRQKIIKNIYQSILPGGCFILIEKVLGSTSEVDSLMVDLYYHLKSGNGYSALEIERKRLSLEGVLVPVTAKWNEELLSKAGFSEIDCFWRWMNFAGWVAIK